MIAVFLVFGWLFRDTGVVSGAVEFVGDMYHEVNSGSEEHRVKMPKAQRQKLIIDSWSYQTKESRRLVFKMHNSSEWVVSSVDVQISSQSGANKRVFRVFPVQQGSRVFAGPNTSFVAFGDLGEFPAFENGSATILVSYGYSQR